MNEVIELIGDLWTAPIDYPPTQEVRIVLIPTNGVLHANGNLVMGAGVAKQAAKRYPDLSWLLGLKVKAHGNHAYVVGLQADDPFTFLMSWPTKHDWRDPSDLDLICREAKRIMRFMDSIEHPEPEEGEVAALGQSVVAYAPLVGCGLGGLKWDEVREALAPIVKDRIYFVKQLR